MKNVNESLDANEQVEMMREFVRCIKMSTAKKHCPWAVKTVQVTNGYLCFENWMDYNKWKHNE
jgi:hypothetical protein